MSYSWIVPIALVGFIPFSLFLFAWLGPFRGVLYATLRLRLGPAPATLVSAALFALAHGYGVVGFVSVFVSGVLWALAYERTRSLLPGMLAHAVSNIQATTIVLATLRF